MNTETTNSADQDEAIIVHGSGSVAHQIIGEFFTALEQHDGYAEIAEKLKATIFDGKPADISLRIAMFGENAL